MIRVGDFPIGPEERRAIEDVLDSGRISEGKYVRKFEFEFAKKIGAEYCVAVSSGTAALIVGLSALINSGKIKAGTKVITTPITYIATSNAILLAGLVPVFVDVDPVTFCITPEAIEHVLKHATPGEYSLVLPVHLMGFPCDMAGINAVAEKYGVLVFEDAAQAHGTRIGDKIAGSMSIMADFSFYIAHNIQVGEMGAVVTNDRALASLARSLKANGRACDCNVCTRSEGVCPHAKSGYDPKFTHNYVGYNFKTMEFQAALGLLQLERLDDIIQKRQQNVLHLSGELLGLEKYLRLPVHAAHRDISYLAYPLVLTPQAKLTRPQVQRALEAEGIETRPLFGCIPTQQPSFAKYKHLYAGKLPNAEYIGENGFYVGCHQYMTKEDVIHIGESIRRVLSV